MRYKDKEAVKVKLSTKDSVYFVKEVGELGAGDYLEALNILKKNEISDESGTVSMLAVMPLLFPLLCLGIEDKEKTKHEPTFGFLTGLLLKDYKPLQLKMLNMVKELFRLEEEELGNPPTKAVEVHK